MNITNFIYICHTKGALISLNKFYKRKTAFFILQRDDVSKFFLSTDKHTYLMHDEILFTFKR
jgi:hypothetical protein